jgi:hypothetical protein
MRQSTDPPFSAHANAEQRTFQVGAIGTLPFANAGVFAGLLSSSSSSSRLSMSMEPIAAVGRWLPTQQPRATRSSSRVHAAVRINQFDLCANLSLTMQPIWAAVLMVACGSDPASSFIMAPRAGLVVLPVPGVGHAAHISHIASFRRAEGPAGLRMAAGSGVNRREAMKQVCLLGAQAAGSIVLMPSAGAETLLAASSPAAQQQAGGAPVMPPQVVLCDQAVSRLVNAKTAQEVYVIGTAHVSTLSAELVRDTIRLVQPDQVMVELDSQRVKKRAPAPAGATSSAGSAANEKPPPATFWGLVKAGKEGMAWRGVVTCTLGLD